MDDDLNISKALSAIFNFIRDANKAGAGKKATQAIKDLDSVLGILTTKKEKIPKNILDLATQRLKARKQKDFKKADALREKIKSLGFITEDTEEGFRIKRL